MKKVITAIAAIIFTTVLTAQNVGIGTNEPYNKLHIVGSLLVNTPTKSTTTVPTAAQTKTLPGLGTISFLNTDSTGRLYDPGGPAGNYGIDLDSKSNIPSSSNIAIEVTAETMDLNTGDSLIIKESSTGPTLLAVGNVYNSAGKWIFNSSSLYINFKSNVDFNTGAGFSLLFRRLYSNSLSLPDISGIAGTAVYFDAKTGAFRSGNINNAEKGQNSTAMGVETTASGNASSALGSRTKAIGASSTALGSGTSANGISSTAMGSLTFANGASSTAMGIGTIADGNSSTAMGSSTIASGDYSTAMGSLTTAGSDYSTAMGRQTTASGNYSTAMGFGTTSSGLFSTAMGNNTTASANSSTAMGFNTTASGSFSTAMGNYVSTNNQGGSFIIGDNSTVTGMISPAPNFFAARFAGGYRLFSSANYSTGCTLFAGDNAWTTSSDIRLKENFEEINGEDFLKKIAAMRLVSWNYKKQDPSKFRHYGPMAQDFYAAFGKDKYGNIGNDTTINQADFDGVNLIAIQALEKRTQKIDRLEKENAEMKAMLLSIQKELDEIKAAKK